MFPDSQGEGRDLALCSELVIKHDLVFNSSVMVSLIFDDALYFFLSVPHFIYLNCGWMDSDNND